MDSKSKSSSLIGHGTSNSHRVAKFVLLSFVIFPNKYLLNLHLLTLLSPFLSNYLGDTKTIRPFALKGHRSIAHCEAALKINSTQLATDKKFLDNKPNLEQEAYFLTKEQDDRCDKNNISELLNQQVKRKLF